MSHLTLPQKRCGILLEEALKKDRSLRKYVINGKNRIDLGNDKALLLYNRLVIQDFLSLDFTVPPGFLIPTVCSRWAFLSWILQDQPSKVLEVGTGASAILALMLAKVGCEYVEATEINEIAYQSAKSNISLNKLDSKIILKKVQDNVHIISSYYDSLTKFDAVICNPPQYDYDYFKQRQHLKKGFFGQESELVGGEKGHEFIVRLIDEVKTFLNPPSLYFHLTAPKLTKVISSFLLDNEYSFSQKQNISGTRRRYFYKVDF